MKKLVLSEEQLKKLLNLVDLNLKLNGLAVLQDTVDLYNVLMTAVPEPPNPEPVV